MPQPEIRVFHSTVCERTDRTEWSRCFDRNRSKSIDFDPIEGGEIRVEGYAFFIMIDRNESRYFPAYCPEGHRPFLAPVGAADAMSYSLRCPVCAAEGRVIPGAYYTAATRDRFERVAGILHEARLSREQTATAVAWLDRAARDAEAGAENVVNALSKAPGLSELSGLVPSDRHERHGFVGLVLALLIAGAASSFSRRADRRIPGEPMLEPTAGEQVPADPMPGVRACEDRPLEESREIEHRAPAG